MVSLEAFSDLLQTLYSAPLQQEQWEHFLTRVCRYTDSTLGRFFGADTGSGLAVLAQGGAQDLSATVSTYNSKYAQSDPFRTAVVRRCRTSLPEGVFSQEELIPSKEFMQMPIYRGLCEPANLRHGVFTILACTLRRLDAIILWRTPEEGPISTDARRLMELLIPHVQTALKIRRALGASEQRLASAEAMANASPMATFVLTGDGRVQHWNTSAESLVRANDIFTIANGRLTTCNREDSAALVKLFRDAVSSSYSLSKPRPSHVRSCIGSQAGILCSCLPRCYQNRIASAPEPTCYFWFPIPRSLPASLMTCSMALRSDASGSRDSQRDVDGLFDGGDQLPASCFSQYGSPAGQEHAEQDRYQPAERYGPAVYGLAAGPGAGRMTFGAYTVW